MYHWKGTTVKQMDFSQHSNNTDMIEARLFRYECIRRSSDPTMVPFHCQIIHSNRYKFLAITLFNNKNSITRTKLQKF